MAVRPRPPRRSASNRQLRSLAMFGGLMIGLGLLSMMRPGSIDVEPVPRARRAVTPELPVVDAPPPAPRAAPVRPLPRPRSPEPSAPPEPVEAPEAATERVDVEYVVRDGRGRPIEGAWLEPVDCHGGRVVSGEVFAAAPGPCTVRPVRRDGLLTVYGEPLTVDVQHGRELTIDATLDEPERGGVGVQLRGSPEGMRVLGVLPGTPADRAGLENGDLIVAVGGQSAVGMSLEDFIAEMTGPAGTDVEFTLQYEGEDGTVQEPLVVTRERLGS